MYCNGSQHVCVYVGGGGKDLRCNLTLVRFAGLSKYILPSQGGETPISSLKYRNNLKFL